MSEQSHRVGLVSREPQSAGRKFWLIFLAVIVSAVFDYPMLNEQASGVCSAAERRFLSLAALAQGDGTSSPLGLAVAGALGSASGGLMGASVAKREFPDVPPFIGCTVLYWRMFSDPGSVQQAFLAAQQNGGS